MNINYIQSCTEINLNNYQGTKILINFTATFSDSTYGSANIRTSILVNKNDLSNRRFVLFSIDNKHGGGYIDIANNLFKIGAYNGTAKLDSVSILSIN